MGPLGLLSPHHGVSYLFAGADAAPTHEGEASLWGIAHASGSGTPAALGGNGGNVLYGGALGSPPPSWSSSLGDTVKQIDSKLKVGLRAFWSCLPLTKQAENYRHAAEGA